MIKYINFMVFLGVLLGSCKWELEPWEKEPDKLPFITGKVVDVLTQEGIPNVKVQVEDFWTDGWNYSVYIEGIAITNAQGEFRVDYSVKNQRDSRILKLDQLPAGYQLAARINGQDEACIFYDYNDLGELFGGYRVEDEGIYKVELMPQTFAYFNAPVIPAGWEKDTMSLKTVYWNNPFMTDPFEVLCSGQSHTETIPLQDLQMWSLLSKPNSLRMGDRIEVEYRVLNGPVTKLSKSLTINCPFKDTTGIYLPMY